MEVESKIREAKYFYSSNGKDEPVGPLSLTDLRVLAARGEINGQTPVIREGANDWGRYRDFQAGERSREVADAVMERAARVAAVLQTPESKSFGFGFLMGLVRIATLPWEIVRSAFQVISEWGAAQFLSIPQDRLACATLGKVVAPVALLAWTGWWFLDCVAMLVVGRPSFSLSVISTWSGFFTMGIPGPAGMGGNMLYSAARAGIADAFTVEDFGNRLAWAIKIGLVGYFLTVPWALLGEIFSGLATLIGLRGKIPVGAANDLG